MRSALVASNGMYWPEAKQDDVGLIALLTGEAERRSLAAEQVLRDAGGSEDVIARGLELPTQI